jgi:hypothetical protein
MPKRTPAAAVAKAPSSDADNKQAERELAAAIARELAEQQAAAAAAAPTQSEPAVVEEAAPAEPAAAEPVQQNLN